MHYVVELDDGERWEVDIDSKNPSSVRVNGVDRDLHVHSRSDGSIVASSEGRSQTVQILFEDGALVVETPDGRRRRARVEAGPVQAWRQEVLRRPPPIAVDAKGDVKAPIAGNVLTLLASSGERVHRGQPLLIIEAMKMQNTISAPKDGFVHYAVKAGQIVQADAPLAHVSATEVLS